MNPQNIPPDSIKIAQDEARNLLVNNGELFLKNHGIEILNKETLQLKTLIQNWNAIVQSTIPLTLQTVDILLLAASMININDPSVLMNKNYNHLYYKLCAIRNQMIDERKKRINSIDPELLK